MNPNDPTGLNKVLMQMQPLMLSRTPDFQKFSSPSELGVPVAVGDASRLPSQCPPKSSNTKLSNSQQHPKAFPFSFTSTHRLPKMSCSIYSPFASMCQHFSGEREKGSLVRRGIFIGYLLSHLSLLSTRRHPNEFQWISDSHQHVTPYYWLALLCWCPLTLGLKRSAPQPSQANTWVCQPGQKALQCVEQFWTSSGTSLKIGEHFSCEIWCSRYLWYRMMSMHPNLYQTQRLGSVRHWKLTPRSGFCCGFCLHAWMATKGPLK